MRGYWEGLGRVSIEDFVLVLGMNTIPIAWNAGLRDGREGVVAAAAAGVPAPLEACSDGEADAVSAILRLSYRHTLRCILSTL